MKEYFKSERWKHQVSGDEILYRAVQRSLDLTIDQLGRKEFDAKLREFRELKAIVDKACANATMPCSPGGKRNVRSHGCLWNDSGCGNTCIDEVLKTLET